jgi:DNA polymerase
MLEKLNGAADVSRSVAICQSLVHLDFETRNAGGCNLKTAGAWRYAADPATEILTMIYRTTGGKPRLWRPGTLELCRPGTSLMALAADPTVTFVCFGDFEMAIWDRIMVERFGFPTISIDRWDNAQATCAYLALPRALDKVLPVIGSEIVKDAAGRCLTLSLSRPHRKTGEYPEAPPEVLERVAEYNKIDVNALVAIHTATGSLEGHERRVWELDQRINQRGVRIDLDFVHAAKRIAEASKDALIEEFAELTRASPEISDETLENLRGLSPHQVSKTREWLKDRGFTLDNLQQATVEEALDEMKLPNDVKRVLQIRLMAAPTSLEKLDAMLACVGADGRACGLYSYHGATPGRWSAQLFQPQNLPRPTVEVTVDEIEELVVAIKTGEADALRRWGDPLEVLTGALRYALIPVEGSLFGVGDFVQIELCILLALAGQKDKCELIASGADIYRDMAAQIYGFDRESFMAIAKDKLTVEHQQQRHIGKNTILGCGYAMGSETFRRRYLRHMVSGEAEQFAKQVIYTNYRGEWAPQVPVLWRDLEHTASRAMLQPGKVAAAKCGISYHLDTIAGLPCLVCTLLNGKRIFYQNARTAPQLSRFGRLNWTYWAYRKGRWREIEPYGGQLTENVVQALARELLVDAMLRFEARGFPIVMHTHDELVIEHPAITEELIKEIMEEPPDWAAKLGVPVMVEAWVGTRYRK